MESFYTLKWTEEGLSLLDQRKLPHKVQYVTLRTHNQVAGAIRDMTVRGAPAIGCAAAYGFFMGLSKKKWASPEELEAIAADVYRELLDTRPTAVNLKWALDRMKSRALALGESPREKILKSLLAEARLIHKEDVEANRRMGEFGAGLIKPGFNILTHCNAGALATGGWGTALGVIRTAFRRYRKIHVWVDETRPRLQGASLTAWELARDGIPFTLIPDNTAGALMRSGQVDFVVTGADRIAANGDAANKIGTYSVAVLANENRVPFYMAAPRSTFDLNIGNGSQIPIERRSEREVLQIQGKPITVKGARALNLAFDVTDARYIKGFITEAGIISPPFKSNIAKAFAGK